MKQKVVQKPSVIKIYSDHIQKRIEELENQINRNYLVTHNKYKIELDELFIQEEVIQYELRLMEYQIEVEELNAPLYSELQHLLETCVPVKTVELSSIYFHDKVC